MLNILVADCLNVRVSELVWTKPIGIEEQPDFMNGAVSVETDMEQAKFKLYLKSIEDQLGRDRNLPKFGPRTMDLDIVVWNGEIIDNDFYIRDFLRKSIESLGITK